MPYRKDAEPAKVRIKEAAVRLFATQGFSATATRQIAEEAEVTKPMLYYYFPDKESLYLSIVRDALTSLDASLAEAVTGCGSPVESLRRFVHTYLQFFLNDRHLASVCFQEIFGLGENLLKEFTGIYFDSHRRHVEGLVWHGPRAKSLSATDIEYVSLSLLGIPNMFIMRYILHGGAFDVNAVMNRVIDYYVAEVGEPEALLT